MIKASGTVKCYSTVVIGGGRVRHNTIRRNRRISFADRDDTTVTCGGRNGVDIKSMAGVGSITARA